MRLLMCFVAVVALGCGDAGQTATPARETSKRDGPTEVEMVASMEAHYGIVIHAHDALLQGDLEAFRAQLALAATSTLPDDAPEAWLALHRPLREAAQRGVEVDRLDDAAGALSSVVVSCGRCHEALGTGPVYPAPAPDDGATALSAAMLDHQWATERLWEGVTGPWDNAWQRGADALAVVEIFGPDDATTQYSEDLRSRENRLREIGRRAVDAKALDERAALYGELLATCGECHRAVGVTFEPDG